MCAYSVLAALVSYAFIACSTYLRVCIYMWVCIYLDRSFAPSVVRLSFVSLFFSALLSSSASS